MKVITLLKVLYNMTLNEEWKDIPGYEGLYQVSNLGRVKSLGRVIWQEWKDGTHGRWYAFPEKILKPKIDTNNYLSVGLHKIDRSRKRFRIHRLVAIAFIKNDNNLPHINHKDENTYNNIVDNLEWCDAKYNLNYGGRVEKYRNSRGTRVQRLDLNDNYIDTWNSMTHAAKIVYKNINKESDIRRNCMGKIKRVLNYKWRFDNDA